MNRMRPRPTLLLTTLLLALTTVMVACGAIGVAPNPHTPTPPAEIEDVTELWSKLSQATTSPEENIIVEVWNNLSQEFVEKDMMDASALSRAAIEALLEVQQDGQDQMDPDVLSEVAIEAMLKALGDPYTTYLNPNEYKRYVENSEGKFEGIGAYVDLIDGHITITAAIPHTPADRAGVLPGDVVLEVDGVSTKGWSLIESIIHIRGAKGTPVLLLVQRDDSPNPTLIEIIRDVIQMESVRWEMLPGNIAYIEISTFAENTDEAVAEALREIEMQDAEGMILDVRNNLGGLLSTTVNTASQFLKDGLVLYSVDGDGTRTDYEVKSGGLALDIPLALLVNQFSASASEVLSGALQSHERAILIGTTTYGKGSVNIPKSLSNGASLYFTIGRWYSPNGRLIEGEGLEPDVLVETGGSGDEDPQLEMALEYLNTQIATTSR